MKAFSIALACWFLGCSLFVFLLCAIDKRAAKREKRRIPEKRFFLLALSGGGAGLWCGMLCFRHKTRHWYFWAWAILTTLLQLTLLIWAALKVGQTI